MSNQIHRCSYNGFFRPTNHIGLYYMFFERLSNLTIGNQIQVCVLTHTLLHPLVFVCLCNYNNSISSQTNMALEFYNIAYKTNYI